MVYGVDFEETINQKPMKHFGAFVLYFDHGTNIAGSINGYGHTMVTPKKLNPKTKDRSR